MDVVYRIIVHSEPHLLSAQSYRVVMHLRRGVYSLGRLVAVTAGRAKHDDVRAVLCSGTGSGGGGGGSRCGRTTRTILGAGACILGTCNHLDTWLMLMLIPLRAACVFRPLRATGTMRAATDEHYDFPQYAWTQPSSYTQTRLPVNEATTLPGAVYHDPSFAVLERNRLWRSSWVAAVRAASCLRRHVLGVVNCKQATMYPSARAPQCLWV